MIFGKFLFEKKKSKRGTKRRKKRGLERGDYRVLGWKNRKIWGFPSICTEKGGDFYEKEGKVRHFDENAGKETKSGAAGRGKCRKCGRGA